MAQLQVIYGKPADPEAFDGHYFDIHVPIATTIPGLRRYEVSQGPAASPAGDSGVHLIAILHFDTLADISAAFASPEGQAAAADVPNFATGGAEMRMYGTRDV